MDKLLYGAAYYDEYMPYDRLDKDIEMMQAAGMNVVRIAESTWSTCEPQPGVFDFSHVSKVIDAMEKAGMYVIVGTPTYAVPTWMEKMHPEIMAVQKSGRRIYGARQIMDITDPTYLFYAERVIRRLMETVAHRKCVIGFQLDNETKYYGSAGNGMQRLFVKYLREKFSTAENMNQAFGLDYWSNRVNSWEDFPDVRGTINGSMAAEFDRFRRGVVTDFLAWQASIVREYMRDDQFITHNFDYEWRDWSFGVQPDADHFRIAKALETTGAGQQTGVGEGKAGSGTQTGEGGVRQASANKAQEAGDGREDGAGPAKVQGQTIAGCDIYHPSQDHLTGAEIAFGGDMNRSLLGKNYLVLETEAQGYPWWTPYPGQLRLQAYSHLAAGADMVEYWHWHSIHNSFETYWKGVLSQDFEENDVYREAKRTGQEWKKIGPDLLHLKKHNKAAILVSNDSLSALNYFRIDAVSGDSGKTGYNDIVRWVYDALYQMNIECDFVSPDMLAEDAEKQGAGSPGTYSLLVVPALYSAPQQVLDAINRFTERGGVVAETFKSGFTDENVKVWTDVQPHTLKDAAGVIYHEFAFPERVGLRGKLLADEGRKAAAVQGGAADAEQAQLFMELLEPMEGTEVLLTYDHPAWGRYAAVTRSHYGKGSVYYIGCRTSSGLLKKILRLAAEDAGIEVPEAQWPLIIRRGENRSGRNITYLLNYSGRVQDMVWKGPDSRFLLPSEGPDPGNDPGRVHDKERIQIGPWDLCILEESEA